MRVIKSTFNIQLMIFLHSCIETCLLVLKFHTISTKLSVYKKQHYLCIPIVQTSKSINIVGKTSTAANLGYIISTFVTRCNL